MRIGHPVEGDYELQIHLGLNVGRPPTSQPLLFRPDGSFVAAKEGTGESHASLNPRSRRRLPESSRPDHGRRDMGERRQLAPLVRYWAFILYCKNIRA